MTALRAFKMSNGDIASPPSVVDGAEALGNRARSRLRSFRGEWFLDLRLGMPWFQRVLGQSPTDAEVQAVVYAGLIAMPGVLTVTGLKVSRNTVTRRFSIDGFKLTFDSGFEYEQSIPFLVGA